MDKLTEIEQLTAAHYATAERLALLMATPPDTIEKLYTNVATFVGRVAEIGNLKDDDQWNMLESFNMQLPKRLAKMLKNYTQGSNRLTNLDIQCKKLKFDLLLTAQETYGQRRQLQPKDKELAILHNERYECAVIQYNVQKNLVDYLDKTVDQYKFLNNSVKTRIEIAKLRRELGF